jgi:hypothetical protein
MRIVWWRRRRSRTDESRPHRLADGNEVPLPGYRTYREILAGRHLSAVAGSGGWCHTCRTRYGNPGATMCRSCGRDLRPVTYAVGSP